jgi:agmatine deiminase
VARVVAVLTLPLLLAASAPAVAQPEPAHKLIPNVVPSVDELANPHLYREFSELVEPVPFLGDPPPAGIRHPGEFEPMDATIISIVDWGSQDLIDMWVEMIDVYARAGFVWIITFQDWTMSGFPPLLDAAGVPADRYAFVDYPLDSFWVRDYGPEFVYDGDGARHVIDNAYLNRPADDVIPQYVAASDWIGSDGAPLPLHSHEHHLAGGNYMTDGAGTCFLSNIIYGYEKPETWTDADVDEMLATYMGCEKIYVLAPIPRDTTGHVDLFSKLVGPRAVLLGEFPQGTKFPEDRTTMEDNLAILEQATNVAGDPFVVTRVPMLEPYPGEQAGVTWVYRSYLNSEIVNDYVAMPTYHLPKAGGEDIASLLDKESEAVAAYEAANPASAGKVFPIVSDTIIGYAGAIHCISHEVPEETGGGWAPPSEYCGDGMVQEGEDCERADLDGQTCETLGYAQGVLYCGPGCEFVVTQCSGDAGPQDTDSDGGDAGPAGTDGDTDAGVDGGSDGGDEACGCAAAGRAKASLLGLAGLLLLS